MLMGNNGTGFVICHFFQLETIVQMGCLTAKVTDDVSTQEEFKTKLAVLSRKMKLCLLILDF